MATCKKLKQSGGHRLGAGRPPGTGKFREKTRPVRIPETLVPQVTELLAYYADTMNVSTTTADQPRGQDQDPAYPSFSIPRMSTEWYGDNIFQPSTEILQNFPLYSNRVSAGFPSPADDHIETKLDLNQHLVKRPAATFFVRVEGDSMIGAGIHPNDLLIVDRSIKPISGKVVIAVLNGELTVKRLKIQKEKITLMAENERYSPIIIDETMEFNIWGVVTNVIHAV
jgi:DNA polymerase V